MDDLATDSDVEKECDLLYQLIGGGEPPHTADGTNNRDGCLMILRDEQKPFY